MNVKTARTRTSESYGNMNPQDSATASTLHKHARRCAHLMMECLEDRALLTTNLGWLPENVEAAEHGDLFQREAAAAAIKAPSRISGIAFLDVHGGKEWEPSAIGLRGTEVVVTGTRSETQEAVNVSTTTAANGSYNVSDLFPGNYSITFRKPSGFPDLGILVDSALKVLAKDDGDLGPTFEFAVPEAGGTNWDQVNYVVPDISARALMSSNLGWVRPKSASFFSLSSLSASTYVEDSPPLQFANDLTITGENNVLLRSAEARLTNPLNESEEFLTANVTGTSLTADFDQQTSTLRLAGADTRSNYQTVLRSLTYVNRSQDPDPTPRSIEVAVSDGIQSSQTRAIVVIQPVNDSPNLAPIADQKVTSDMPFALVVTATDPEARDIMTFQLDPEVSPASATIQQTGNNSAIIHWTPSQSDLTVPKRFRVLVVDNGTPPNVDSEEFLVSLLSDDPALIDAALADYTSF